jgi:hypothetical protein
LGKYRALWLQDSFPLYRADFSGYESEAFDNLSRHLCTEMKKHIHADLTQNAEHGLIRKLEEIFPKFHIHGLTTHEILYPFDPHNSAHSRGDGKIFICTHC